jgi:hypothetical protein
MDPQEDLGLKPRLRHLSSTKIARNKSKQDMLCNSPGSTSQSINFYAPFLLPLNPIFCGLLYGSYTVGLLHHHTDITAQGHVLRRKR